MSCSTKFSYTDHFISLSSSFLSVLCTRALHLMEVPVLGFILHLKYGPSVFLSNRRIPCPLSVSKDTKGCAVKSDDCCEQLLGVFNVKNGCACFVFPSPLSTRSTENARKRLRNDDSPYRNILCYPEKIEILRDAKNLLLSHETWEIRSRSGCV